MKPGMKLSVALTLLLTTIWSTQSLAIDLSLTVKIESSGAPLPDAEVHVFSSDGQTLSMSTNSEGHVSFSNLAPGNTSIEVNYFETSIYSRNLEMAEDSANYDINVTWRFTEDEFEYAIYSILKEYALLETYVPIEEIQTGDVPPVNTQPATPQPELVNGDATGCSIAAGDSDCAVNIWWEVRNAPNAGIFYRTSQDGPLLRSDCGTTSPCVRKVPAGEYFMELRADINDPNSKLLAQKEISVTKSLSAKICDAVAIPMLCPSQNPAPAPQPPPQPAPVSTPTPVPVATSGHITVCVTYQGYPVGGATITPTNAPPGITGGNGCLAADNIPFGNYSGTVSKDSITVPFFLTFLNDGQTITLAY